MIDERERMSAVNDETRIALAQARSNSEPVPEPDLVSIVVPTRDDFGDVARLRDAFASVLQGPWEVLLITDSDERVARLMDLASNDPRVRIVRRDPRVDTPSLGGVVRAGFAAAAGEVLVVLEQDVPRPDEIVMELVEALALRRADVVVATRFHGGALATRHNGFVRYFASRACRMLVQAALPRARGTSDPLGRSFAVRRSVVENVALRPDAYRILLEILVRGQWNQLAEVPYPDAAGASTGPKFAMREGLRFLRHVRALRDTEACVPGYLLEMTRTVDMLSEPPLRTLVLTSEGPPVVSGISTAVATLSEGLRQRGLVVDVVTRDDFPRLVRREIRISAFALFWPRFRRRLRDYDVVNIHGPVPTMSEVFLVLARTLRGNRPAIVYTHHSDLAIPRLERCCRVYNRLTRRLAQSADAIVVSSGDYAEKLRRAQGAPVEVVAWGVRSSGMVQQRGVRPTDALRVLFVGQLRPYKGVHVLFDAVASLPEVTVTVIGDGPMRAELEAKAATLPFRNATLAGRVSDRALWQAYSENDVIVLPSTTTAEAFGLVLAEGMAAGCVPVASDLPGVRGVAQPTGIVVKPGDAEDLRRALRLLASDPAQLERMRTDSTTRAQQFSIEAMAARYERVLRTAASTTAGRQGHRAVPSAWDDPERLLEALIARVGVSQASLALLGRTRGEFSPVRVWTNDLKSMRVVEAPVAAYVARLNRPLLIRADMAVEPELETLLLRPSLTSSILVPVHRTRRSVSVVSISTSSGDHHLGPQDVEMMLDLVSR